MLANVDLQTDGESLQSNFDGYIGQIYPPELEFSDETTRLRQLFLLAEL